MCIFRASRAGRMVCWYLWEDCCLSSTCLVRYRRQLRNPANVTKYDAIPGRAIYISGQLIAMISGFRFIPGLGKLRETFTSLVNQWRRTRT